VADIYPRYEGPCLVNPFFIGERVVVCDAFTSTAGRRYIGRFGTVADHQWNQGTGEWWVRIDGRERNRLFHTDELRRLDIVEQIAELARGDR